MQQKTKDKLLLCLQEMYWVKEILDEKCASNQLAHILGIYTAIRMDDFIHMLPTSAVTNDKSPYISEHKQGYKEKLEEARNKLGAHFQTIVQEDDDVTTGLAAIDEDEAEECKSDYIERNRVFQDIDYKTVIGEIENAKIVYQITTETETTEPTLAAVTTDDKQKIIEVCKSTNHDGAAVVSTDILNISRPNAICLISGTSAQQKAQQLLSVEQFVDDIRELYDQGYNEAGLHRMFKRMMMCWMLNYYDNLVTRSVDPTAPQYDEGFDKKVVAMFEEMGLTLEANACKDYYAKMSGLKDSQQIIDDARFVRNKSCGHLDGAMDVAAINGLIDGYDMSSLMDLYGKWVQTFHEILNIHVTLSHLYLPLNTVYNVQMEKIDSNYFYCDDAPIDSAMYDTSSITVEQAMNAIANGTQDKYYALADEKINLLLRQAEGEEYGDLKQRLIDKYSTTISNYELLYYCDALMLAKRGNPEKNLELILELWNHLKAYDSEVHRWLLIPMMWNARFDSNGQIRQIIDELKISTEAKHVLFGGLILFFANNRKDCGLFAYQDNPAFSKEVSDYVDAIIDIPQRLALVLALASYWFTGELYHKTWQSYSDSLLDLAMLVLERYLGGIEMTDKDKNELKQMLQDKRFVELIWYLIKGEKQMLRGVTCFESLVGNGQIRGYVAAISERAYWALCQEEIGNVDKAYKLLKRLMNENLYNSGLYMTTYKFLGRHSQFKQERIELGEEINKMFTLTDKDRMWMEM